MEKIYEEIKKKKSSVIELCIDNQMKIYELLKKNYVLDKEISEINENIQQEKNNTIEKNICEIEKERLEKYIIENNELIKSIETEIEEKITEMLNSIKKIKDEIIIQVNQIEEFKQKNIDLKLKKYEELNEMKILKNNQYIEKSTFMLKQNNDLIKEEISDLNIKKYVVDSFIQDFNMELKNILKNNCDKVQKIEINNNKDKNISIEFDITTGSYEFKDNENSFKIEAYNKNKNKILSSNYKKQIIQDLKKMQINENKVNQLDPMIYYIFDILEEDEMKERYIKNVAEKQNIPFDLKYNMMTKINGHKRIDEAKIGIFKKYELNKIAKNHEKIGAKVNRNINEKIQMLPSGSNNEEIKIEENNFMKIFEYNIEEKIENTIKKFV